MIWNENSTYKQQQNATAYKGGNKVPPQLDFFFFFFFVWDIIQDTWQHPKYAMTSLFFL